MKTLKNNKGFTLIEIVIVIVIIAILAAMLVPSMLSWIDSANERTFLSACDSIEATLLTEASETYASTGKFEITDWDKVSDLVGSEVVSGATVGEADYAVSLPAAATLSANKNLEGTVITDGTYFGYAKADGSWGVGETLDEAKAS